ncbi:MAG: ATP-binding protein, partial [Chloroflexi bacterium]|nr:ATP-binding protein [Chloroflexota bacterium]
MNHTTVRIDSIVINNFKSTRFGEVVLSKGAKDYSANVLGLYGQNGSGKTALIDAIALLKYALTSTPIPVRYADYVNNDAEYANFMFELSVMDRKRSASYRVKYEFSLRKIPNENPGNTSEQSEEKEPYIAELFNEVLSYSYESADQKFQMQKIVDTQENEIFGPKTKYDVLTGGDKSAKTDLLVARKLAAITATSFVFSYKLIEVIRKNCQEEPHVLLFNALTLYGNTCLFVIETRNSGIISLNAQPFAFRVENEAGGMAGQMALPLDRPADLNEENYSLTKKIVSNMNIVLMQLVPGLSIDIVDLGKQLSKKGNRLNRVELVSLRNGKGIPLRYESEGIKKIISILQLLIVMYNNDTVTIAIDELDAGIFEYLLGELLRIISQKRKGQLIFTSHN